MACSAGIRVPVRMVHCVTIETGAVAVDWAGPDCAVTQLAYRGNMELAAVWPVRARTRGRVIASLAAAAALQDTMDTPVNTDVLLGFSARAAPVHATVRRARPVIT